MTHCGDSFDAPTEDPLWDSGVLTPGESFSYTFDTPGTYVYRCDFHPVTMGAVIVVQAREAPTATGEPTPAATPSPTAGPATTRTPTPTPMPSLSVTTGPDGDNGLSA